MKVFISWSGNRSKATAIVLKRWLGQVIQATEPWISADIDKGTRWNDNLNAELEQTRFGIICLNKDNLNSEWILFEAGALSKTTDANVCTFLLDIKPTDIKPPLGQFQHTIFEKEDVKKLVHTINDKITKQGEKTIKMDDLNEVFEHYWTKLQAEINEIKNISITDYVQRTDRELLEEILQLVRPKNPFTEVVTKLAADIRKKYESSDKDKFFDDLKNNLDDVSIV